VPGIVQRGKSVTGVSAFGERKIGYHNHVLDLAQFPFAQDVKYQPVDQEIWAPDQLATVCDAYGVNHGLIVGPNSGYGSDKSCLLDKIQPGNGRHKGIAVVLDDCPLDHLEALKATSRRRHCNQCSLP
jgi:hypothetical protein